MDKIYEFCRDAERIYASTENTSSLKEMEINIDIKKDEVWRSIYNKNMDCIFTFELSYGDGHSIVEQVDFMKTIELYYPGIFSWRYNGKNIEVTALVPFSKKEYLGIFGRYKGVLGFVSKLRHKITDVLKYRDFAGVAVTKFVDKKIIATGSINTETNMYCINISPDKSMGEIVIDANMRKMSGSGLKELDMRYWVREMNPDYYKDIRTKTTKKLPISDEIWTKYPKAIQKIAGLKKKGNYNRFLLATYFLGIHNERDAKHQLFSCLSDGERQHMSGGNCKDQWRAIVAKGYSPPSIKTLIEHGFAETADDCEPGWEEEESKDI